jgi:hypothetical protein
MSSRNLRTALRSCGFPALAPASRRCPPLLHFAVPQHTRNPVRDAPHTIRLPSWRTSYLVAAVQRRDVRGARPMVRLAPAATTTSWTLQTSSDRQAPYPARVIWSAEIACVCVCVCARAPSCELVYVCIGVWGIQQRHARASLHMQLAHTTCVPASATTCVCVGGGWCPLHLQRHNVVVL